MADPAYFKAFKKLIRSEPTLVDLPMMVIEFYGESDRAAILLSAALIDVAIEVALSRLLRDDNNTLFDLFDHEGPLGSFSRKIKMGFALNLYDRHTNHDLEIIRQLRNGFAHDRRHLRFDTPEVANMCKHLRLPDTQYAKIPEAYLQSAKDRDSAKDINQPKTRYVTACNTIAFELVKFGRTPRDLPPDMPGTSLPRLP
jgi:DNA-binding MltR family transcriptional regulator